MLATSRLSVSIWRNSRTRVAPSDARIASSRARRVARANCMFITFTQAMRRTPTPNPSMVSSVPRSGSGVNVLMSGCTRPVLNGLFVSGYASAKRLANVVNSALAWSSETPCLIRPSTEELIARGSFRARTGNSGKSGSQSSSFVGKLKPEGITPMMVAGLPLIRTCLPMTSDAPPKSRCQMTWPMIAVRSAPGLLSSAVKSRPWFGAMPRIRRKSSVMYAPT